jgi:protein SCO1
MRSIQNKIFPAALLLSMLLSCAPDKPTILLPVYGEKKATGEDTTYHKISNFSLTNQHGETVNSKTIEGKIVVSNFFFATCQSICPEMSTNLVDVQEAFKDDDSLLILSHSVNPLHDTVEVLQGYAQTYGAKKNKWHLLTGDKKQIYDLAKYSYLVNALEDDGTPEGFLHSELLLLVDTQGRLRGMYDGTNKAQVAKLIEDVKILKKEI